METLILDVFYESIHKRIYFLPYRNSPKIKKPFYKLEKFYIALIIVIQIKNKMFSKYKDQFFK